MLASEVTEGKLTLTQSKEGAQILEKAGEAQSVSGGVTEESTEEGTLDSEELIGVCQGRVREQAFTLWAWAVGVPRQ